MGRSTSRCLSALLALTAVTGCAPGPATTPVPQSSRTSAPAPTPSSSTVLPGAPPPDLGAPVAPEADRPVRVAIPVIGVDVEVLPLGTTAEGSVAAPADFATAGWYDRSAGAGQRGPAVVAGHVDSRTGPAVFYRVGELVAGDLVVLTTRGGVDVEYSVDGVEQYSKDAFPTEAVYGPAPGPVLRLVTCGGSFDQVARSYRDNVVVYASINR